MTPSSGIGCVYDPETLTMMTHAFDRACNFLPTQFRDSDYMRRKLALHIIHEVDDGENVPTRRPTASHQDLCSPDRTRPE